MSQNGIRVLKTFLNSFGDRRHVLCCNNAVNKHDFTNESIDKTPKYTGVDQILQRYGAYSVRDHEKYKKRPQK